MSRNSMICLLLMLGFVLTTCAPKEPASPKETVTATDGAKTIGDLELGKATILDLKISQDGKSIIDAQGNEIARFTEGLQVQLASSAKSAEGSSLSIPGCMCCKDDCLIYDSNGKCIKKYRNCTWDFDCNCK